MRVLILTALVLAGCARFGMPVSEHPSVPPETAKTIADMECPMLRLTRRAIEAVEDGITPPSDLSGDPLTAYDLVKDLSPQALIEADDLARFEMRVKRCAILL